ncbi:dihydrodipicolinate reductase [Flavimaricola marinus]|uniref:Dihydrodipicolinate reductase n=1 Tax=Flavimaricola marinus TaxID=1819565 RepID=A0A238LHD5_9RHOB|nr:dihydrodipicolinate reductase [Flavimaricola marinus]SMY08992.1 hypothetical protein LOM8899_03152 [Flavimaricola marinus]
MKRLIAAALIALTAAPAVAQDFSPITSRDAFLQMIADRQMRLGRFGVNIVVRSNGAIDGSAVGWPITGSWTWQNGYFCRDMDWSGTEIPYNCQLVEAAGDRVRFTVDQGAGDSAVFRLQ